MDYTAEEALIPAASYQRRPRDGLAGAGAGFLPIGGGGRRGPWKRSMWLDRSPGCWGKTLVTDGGASPLQYGDIAILLRSTKNKAEKYLEVLRRRKIPGWADSQGDSSPGGRSPRWSPSCGRWTTPLDVDLTAAMLSPLFGFTADELAQLRLSAPKASIYEGGHRLTAASSEKTARFWRPSTCGGKQRCSPQELVQKVYGAPGLS